MIVADIDMRDLPYESIGASTLGMKALSMKNTDEDAVDVDDPSKSGPIADLHTLELSHIPS
jgi:hypothetical protein